MSMRHYVELLSQTKFGRQFGVRDDKMVLILFTTTNQVKSPVIWIADWATFQNECIM